MCLEWQLLLLYSKPQLELTFVDNVNRQPVSNREPCACEVHAIHSGNFPNHRSCLGIHQPVAPAPLNACKYKLWCSNVNNAQGRSFDDAELYFGNSKQTSKARGLPDNNLMKSFAPEKEKPSSVRKRPLNKKESAKNEEDIITTETHSSCLIVHETKTQDSNHIGTSVSIRRKRTRQDSQVGSSSCEAGPSKRVRHPTTTDRFVSIGRANQQPPTVSCACT
ncbi:hypothetical protein Tco_1401797 [Tanacetum coccineum]